ncbi:hypothetical protein [Mucilaginibacter ginkgonis]|uniref:GAF domain-containing protein n=1 Tax=Mucilaginibacter ginkgonis TaxID=2682091 RepID=A0A6I4I2P6_9SPHI|nr:hypothetical protein [Mucilaginibacter ginkgonis]QQL49081.1 hypothetical protein GO620_012970 [Mucilaginibacter ginkgonis]
MHSGIFHINKHTNATIDVDTAYSYKAFTDDLRHRISTETTIKGQFYKMILDSFSKHPELEGRLTAEEAIKYPDILELVYAVISPAIVNEQDYYWGIGSAIPGEVIYSTNGFYKFIKAYHEYKNSIINQDKAHFKNRQEDFFYRLILEKLYRISSDLRNDVIYTQMDEARHLEKYFQIRIDTTYVQVTPKQPLPELNPELIEQFLHENAGHEIFCDLIPMDMFTVTGFSLITVEDITAQHSIDKIKLALVNDSANTAELFAEVGHHLQTLTNHSSIEFSLLPFLKVNGNLVLQTEECFGSVLMNAFSVSKVSDEKYNATLKDYIKNPRAVFYNEIKEGKIKDNLSLESLHKAGIVAYAVLPVYYSRQLTGVLEIYSRKNVIHFERLLSKLEAAVPLLSQLLHNSIEQFNARIQNVIKEKFTRLQKSVEWKFNEAAWDYIRAKDSGKRQKEIDSVSFRDVYPLYGAVDIRNSTHKRNEALQQDLDYILTHAVQTLSALSKLKPKATYARQIKQLNRWKNRIGVQITDNDEMHIRTFVQEDIHPLLDKLKDSGAEASKLIENYFEQIDEHIGEGFARRRDLESSMSLINRSLNSFFESAQHDLQRIYPSYFEKFRTDGVEYDVYAGQEIAPAVPFTPAHVHKFRKWQLTSMIEIVKLTAGLKAKMRCKLDTTQLIFVHANPIDICFRKDERRFDVEGAYNIRYEVVKKRIDKVFIKGTEERLTQPGMIAIVYFDEAEADEFISYIDEARKQKLISGKTQFHDLESLQGVTGLKALRVKVNLKG